MRLRKASLQRLYTPLGRPIRNAHSHWSERSGLHLLLEDDCGRVGVGEASPLPNYSPESLQQAEDALASIPWKEVDLPGLPQRARGALDDLLRLLPEDCPSARFATETALADLWSQDGDPAQLFGLRETPPTPPLACTQLLPAVAPAQWVAEARVACEAGASGLKVKLGLHPFEEELSALYMLRSAIGPEVALRLDVNQSWSLDACRERLALLAELEPEGIEEPLPWPLLADLGASPIPILLDESLQDRSCRSALPALLRDRKVHGLLLKPTTLGGVRPCLALGRVARRFGAWAAVSHCFEGPVAYAALLRLARYVASGHGNGIAPHPALALRPKGPPRPLAAPPQRRAKPSQPGKTYPFLPTTHAFAEGRKAPSISFPSWRGPAEERPQSLSLASLDVRWTWSAMGEACARWSRWLDEQRLHRLAVVAVRHPEVVALLLAAIDHGTTLILLHPQWSAADRERALELAPAQRVIDASEVEALSASLRADEARSKHQSGPDDRTNREGEGPAPGACDASRRRETAPSHPLAILFTSGSTGHPKAVVLSHAAFDAAVRANWTHLGVRKDDRWFLGLSLAHIGGFSILLRAAATGTAVILWPEQPFSGPAAVEVMRREEATLASLVPTMLARILSGSAPSAPERLRAVLVGGASLRRDLLDEARSQGWPLLRTYGMTETCAQIATEVAALPVSVGATDTVGPLLPGVEMELRNGVLWIRGPTLATEVLGAEDEFLDDAGWFCTGDLAALDPEGQLVWMGRADEQINSGGERVHPAEIERALRALDGVGEACALGRPHPEWGEALWAAVAPKEGAELDPAELLLQLRSLLAPWKRPQEIAVVKALPRTPSGKVNRAKVADLL